jgi:zinc resistance-associated protein
MWKAVLAGSTALAIAGSTLVYAQQRPGGPGAPGGPDMQDAARWRPSAEDMRAFGEARIAALKAGLLLNADQEKSWPAYEQAVREFAKLRLDRMRASRTATPPTDPVERMRARANAMSETGSALKKLVDATDPLYRSLDDGQKHRFMILAGRNGMGRPGMGHHGMMGRPGMMGPPGGELRDREDGPRGFERGGPDGGPREHFRRGSYQGPENIDPPSDL